MSALAPSTPTPAPPVVTSPAVAQVPISLLRTSLAALRSPMPRTHSAELAELPIRVVPQQDGSFEVADGFKRLARCRDAGHTTIPAVVECVRSPPEIKLFLLRSNAPPRTTTLPDAAQRAAVPAR